MGEYDIVSDSEDESEQSQRLNLRSKKLDGSSLHQALLGCDGISELDLTDNNVGSEDGLAQIAITTLDTLLLDKNNVIDSALAALPPLPRLTHIWLNSNNLTTPESVARQLARACPNLECLSAVNNPMNTGVNDTTQPQCAYRLAFIVALPKLKMLDAMSVSDSERAAAAHLREARDAAREAAKQSRPLSAGRTRTFIGRGRVRYDGSQSEGNRFIENKDL